MKINTIDDIVKFLYENKEAIEECASGFKVMLGGGKTTKVFFSKAKAKDDLAALLFDLSLSRSISSITISEGYGAAPSYIVVGTRGYKDIRTNIDDKMISVFLSVVDDWKNALEKRNSEAVAKNEAERKDKLRKFLDREYLDSVVHGGSIHLRWYIGTNKMRNTALGPYFFPGCLCSLSLYMALSEMKSSGIVALNNVFVSDSTILLYFSSKLEGNEPITPDLEKLIGEYASKCYE